MSGDEIWDEEQWEAYLRESDRRTDRYMELMHGFLDHHPRPDEQDAQALKAWKKALERFLKSKGWDRDDLALPFLWLEEEEPLTEEEQAWMEEMNAAMDEEDLAADLPDFRDLPIYQQAFQVVTEVLEWTDGINGEVKDSTLVQFCNHIMQVPAKIAKGHGFGYERDTLGGNIACVKRGLSEANAALELLRSMKKAPYMDERSYRYLAEQIHEVRNAVGLYVQELRARFNLGID